MANLPENHREMMTLDGLYEQLRKSLICGSPEEQNTLKKAFVAQLDYTLAAADCRIQTKATEAASQLSLLDEESAPEPEPEPDRVGAIAR